MKMLRVFLYFKHSVFTISLFLSGIVIFSFLLPSKAFAGTETISFSSSSSVTSASGNVGDTTNTVFLSGGAKRTTYTFYWDSTSTGTTVNLGTCATSGSGTTCNLAITIPHSSKGNWIIHDNSSGGNGANTLTFTVSPKISSSTPSSGTVGTSVTVSGTGFAAETVTVSLGSTTLGTGTPTSGAGGTNGDLTVTANTPTMTAGSKAVSASGSLSGSISSSFTFTVTPGISLSSSSGAWGSTTTISGNGFAASSTITIKQDGTNTSTTGSSASDGTFSGVIYTPTGTAGTHTISATDGTNTSGTQNYTMSPAITLSSTSGNTGATTNVSGNGYAGNSTITILEDGSTTTTTGTSNASGSFTNINFTPTGSTGLHTINAKDASSNQATAQNYTITASGTLSLIIPGSATLSNVTLAYPNPSGTGSLGTVEVNDSRGTNVGWSLTATSTNFGIVGSAVLVSGSHNTFTSGGTYDYTANGIYTITITGSGQVGHSTYSVSGLESATSQTTASNVSIGTHGVTASFATANYNVGDSWTINVYAIPLDSNGYFTINPNNSTFAVVSGSSTGVSVGTSHGFTSNTDSATITSASSGHGNGDYTINPSLSLTVPIGTYAGNYTATITETVQ